MAALAALPRSRSKRLVELGIQRMILMESKSKQKDTEQESPFNSSSSPPAPSADTTDRDIDPDFVPAPPSQTSSEDEGEEMLSKLPALRFKEKVLNWKQDPNLIDNAESNHCESEIVEFHSDGLVDNIRSDEKLPNPQDQEVHLEPSQLNENRNENSNKKPKRMCKFCDEFQTHLTRHIKRKHSTEEEVIAALKLPSKEQNRMFDTMKKSGIFKANAEIRRKDKQATLLRERRQGNADTVMCSGCLGFFDGKNIFRHKEKCSRAMSLQADTIKMTSLSGCAKEIGVDDEFKTNVIDRFRKDDVGEICRTDLVVLLLGKKQWARSVKKERSVIMGEMRLLANLIFLLRAESENENASGLDVLDYKQFSLLEKVVIKLCDKDDGQKAGLKVRIGFVLKKAVNVMKGYFVMKGVFDKEQDLSRFIDVLNLNWSFIFYSAQVECELKRGGLRKPAAIPLEEDISIFRKYMLQEMANGMAQFDLWDKHTFIYMRNIILSRVTMFNARRGGEPSRLTLAEWRDAITGAWIDPNLIMGVDDPMEKYLIDNLKLAYQAGKGNRKLVPVLFPMDTIEPITKLLSERINCNVSIENTYLFPNTGQSTDHASGYHCLQSVVKRCPGLKQPHLLIADKFRHRVSTMFAQLDIPEEQRTIFYRHMGHSESVNRNVYQCPLAVTEITKVGNFLLNSVDGTPQPQRISYEEGQISKSDICSTTLPQQHEQSSYLSEQATVNEQNVQLAGSKKSPDEKVTKRQYTKWSDRESDIVNSYFKKYITDTSNKGCLPSKKDVLEFLSNYKVLEGCENKATLVRNKIFNEKKKFRSFCS